VSNGPISGEGLFNFGNRPPMPSIDADVASTRAFDRLRNALAVRRAAILGQDVAVDLVPEPIQQTATEEPAVSYGEWGASWEASIDINGLHQQAREKYNPFV
jgi:hypothetical protein